MFPTFYKISPEDNSHCRTDHFSYTFICTLSATAAGSFGLGVEADKEIDRASLLFCYTVALLPVVPGCLLTDKTFLLVHSVSDSNDVITPVP